MLRHGIAGATRAGYRRHFRKYVDFAAANGLEPGPPSEIDLMFFACHLAKSEQSAPATIKATLSGVSDGFVARGYSSPLRDRYGVILPRLARTMRGISRKFSRARRTRLPLTTDKLKAVLAAIEGSGRSKWDKRMLAAALTLGAFLMLRVSEFTSPGIRSHNPRMGACLEGIEFLPSIDDPKFVVLNVKVSKTDPFRDGIDLRMAANGTKCCPVNRAAKYVRMRINRGGDPKSPLFLLKGGAFLTRDRLQRGMRSGLTAAGLDAAKYATHSLRIGGACSLAASGWDSASIQTFGRWRSDAFLSYIRVSDQMLRKASKSMAGITKQDLLSAKRAGRGHKWVTGLSW